MGFQDLREKGFYENLNKSRFSEKNFYKQIKLSDISLKEKSIVNCINNWCLVDDISENYTNFTAYLSNENISIEDFREFSLKRSCVFGYSFSSSQEGFVISTLLEMTFDDLLENTDLCYVNIPRILNLMLYIEVQYGVMFDNTRRKDFEEFQKGMSTSLINGSYIGILIDLLIKGYFPQFLKDSNLMDNILKIFSNTEIVEEDITTLEEKIRFNIHQADLVSIFNKEDFDYEGFRDFLKTMKSLGVDVENNIWNDHNKAAMKNWLNKERFLRKMEE